MAAKNDDEPPEGMVAPNLVIARAGGPHGDSEVVQIRMRVGAVDRDALGQVREAVEQLYRMSFEQKPARVKVVVLPWFAQEDDPEDAGPQ